MTPKKQVDFIEKIAKSKLGLEGMKIVVDSDKNRGEQLIEEAKFDKIGKECIETINAAYIMKTYHIPEGIELKRKMHEERIHWLKKYNQQIDNKTDLHYDKSR